jgi:hypothetical protein
MTSLRESAVRVPATTPGNDTSSASGRPSRALKNGRPMIWVSSEPTAKRSRLRPRKKNSPSSPHVWSQSSHIPAVTRNPLRKSLFSRCPPKSTSVVGLPSAPAPACGLPGRAVTASGGSGWPEVTQ